MLDSAFHKLDRLFGQIQNRLDLFVCTVDLVQPKDLLELLLKSPEVPLIDSGEQLHALLHRFHRGGRRGVLSRHLTREDLRNGCQLVASFHNHAQKLEENLTGLSEREREDVVLDVLTSDIHLSPLTGSKRHAASAEA